MILHIMSTPRIASTKTSATEIYPEERSSVRMSITGSITPSVPIEARLYPRLSLDQPETRPLKYVGDSSKDGTEILDMI